MDPFSSVLQLVDDAEGGIRYWPDVISADLAQAWFEALRDGIDWQRMSRPMYDRVVEVPRLLASWRLASVPAGLPVPELLAHVQGVAPAPYNAVGLNLYRDGRDSVAMHNDKLHTLIHWHPITLVSLGAPRQMNIRARAGGKLVRIDLQPGSVLGMSHASQRTHGHGIPKTARDPGPRMSVVFRVRPGLDG